MDAEPLIGRTLIGRFRIDRVLGRGGMATVYAAFDQQRGTPVALKVLKRELTRDAMILRRFEREAKAASHLSHPNVVEVVDWGVDQEEAFIAMELAQGLDLLKALAQERPMRQARAAVLLAQVCAALSAAHAKGIIHRDLKPENILLVPDPTEPGGERAKVLDFGIAKIMDASKNPAAGDDPPSYVTKTALTRVGTIVGTPAYMSPEQCRGGDIDGRSDIYACGVLLYQLVTGELPFTGETPLHTAMRHIHAQPRPPSELRRNLEPQLEQVILKALAKWPGERQQTAEVLREELHAVVPLLPDRGDIVIPDRNAPRSAPAKPNPPQLSSGSRSPNALQLASEGSTGGRLGSPQPGATQARPAPGSAPVPPPTGAPPRANATDPIAAAPERQESKLVDSDPATRQQVGGQAAGGLGSTPLLGVRLNAPSEAEAKPSQEGAISAASPSLVPSTTRPEAPALASAAAPSPPPVDDDDDEPRTFLMHTDDPRAGVDRSNVAPATQASPSTTPPAAAEAEGSPRPVEVTTDPMEAARSAAKKEPAKPAIKTEPIAGIRERLDSTTSLKEVPRIPARTDRSPGRLPPRLIKSTETGLTPTAGSGAPRPRGDALPTPPIALAAIPPVPPGNGASGIGRTDRGPIPGVAPRPIGAPASAAAQALVAAPSAAPEPNETSDDDEPATYIREPTGFAGASDGPPASNNNLGRTLVMEEQAPQNARPAHPSAVKPPNVVLAGGPALAPLGNMEPKASPSAAASPTALSPYAEPFEDEAIRALKATSRIAEDAANASGLHPQAAPSPHGRLEDPQIKATVRMNPQETMQRIHGPQGAPMHGHGQGAPPQAQLVPVGGPAAAVPPPSQGRIEPTLPGNATYGQLQPGQWNEPTVVRRKQDPYGHAALARSQKTGLVAQLSNLSGTTGLLIGVGLGLGLAAGLLIAFLLLR